MSPSVDQRLISDCKAAAALGAEAVTSGRADFAVREKGHADFVTEVDLASQQAITDYISKRYPTHHIVGEEGADADLSEDGYCWLIDPLDGTTNFVHGVPHYAVSVALTLDSRPLVGCIIDPLRDERFWAAVGAGAWLNDQRIMASATPSMGAALVAVSLAAKVDINSVDVARMLTTLQTCQAVRRFGSAALNLAYIAAGRLDAYWASTLQPWDVAAGIVLIQEAGGVISRIDGGTLALSDPRLCTAGNQSLHSSLLELLNPHQV